MLGGGGAGSLVEGEEFCLEGEGGTGDFGLAGDFPLPDAPVGEVLEVDGFGGLGGGGGDLEADWFVWGDLGGGETVEADAVGFGGFAGFGGAFCLTSPEDDDDGGGGAGLFLDGTCLV